MRVRLRLRARARARVRVRVRVRLTLALPNPNPNHGDALERPEVSVEKHAPITARVHGGVAESKLVKD